MSEPELQIGECIDIGGDASAAFDGSRVVLYANDINGESVVVHITPVMMAHLFWLNRRIQDQFPASYVIDISDLDL
jgi:hypothetical protein